MPQRYRPERIERVLAAMLELRDAAIARERSRERTLSRIPLDHRPSARNLVHYLALRGRDVRLLQLELSRLGLSSLGRCESHVMATVDAVLAALHRIGDRPMTRTAEQVPPVDFDLGPQLLQAHADALMAPSPGQRSSRIMVTLPSEAAQEPRIARELVAAGMDAARINAAHDDPAAWHAMIRNVRDAGAEEGRSVRILIDLPGPKLRTSGPGRGGEEHVRVAIGDELVVTADESAGRAAVRDATGAVVEPARIGCTLGPALVNARPGESIWFDDGKIGGVVEAVDERGIRVRVTRAKPGGSKLRPAKGLNLPDTDLRVPHLTEADLDALDTVARDVDMIGLSFVERAEDVMRLEDELEARGASDKGIVLKIETRRAFEALPELLLAGLRSPPLGVMVARGDLAVEVGFARLAEVQEEILWLCEAAHVPVIWATQVLESMAKKGMPSRAEVSDAALGVRAECVMLNKGPHIVQAVRFLDDVLRRMQAHQSKKRAMLRRLELATRNGEQAEPERPIL